MVQQIAEALSRLVGLPLWGSHRALNMQMFAFGARKAAKNHKGEEIEFGEYALHVQCTWRIVSSDRIIVGSEDRHYPAQGVSFWKDFNSDLDSSLLDSRVSHWLDEHKSNPLRVKRISPGPPAGFQLYLERGFVLEVFPEHASVMDSRNYGGFFNQAAMIATLSYVAMA
jgi:hypothetical protein